MRNEKEILSRLIGIECPVDHVVDRVMDVLEDYNTGGEYQIASEISYDHDEDGLKVYTAYSENHNTPSFILTVREGKDHYVAKVIDAHTV